MTFREQVASDLLQINAIKIQPHNPFTWASGIKSPIYCDNRIALSHPKVRKNIIAGFQNLIEDAFDVNLIAGVATAGIAHAALLAHEMDLPMAYVRSQSKSHGRQNKIEGQVKSGAKAVLIEDLISTGGSSLEAARSLQDANVEVVCVLAIFTYGFELAKQNFEDHQIPLKTITNFDTLLEVAKSQNYLTDEEVKIVSKFISSPNSWNN